MQKPKRIRLNPVLLLALLATALATVFAPDPSQSPDTVVPAPRSQARRASPDRTATPDQVVPASEQGEVVEAVRVDVGRIVDIFAVPRKPAPKNMVEAAPPAPRMPAFDYQYMGRVVDQGMQTLFFTRAGRPYVVKPGDTLDENFLFESVNGNAAVFVYVPLSMRTTVVLGEEK